MDYQKKRDDQIRDDNIRRSGTLDMTEVYRPTYKSTAPQRGIINGG
jgi:hypothetical protein